MAQVWREWAYVVVVSMAGLPLAVGIAVALARWRRRSGVPIGRAWTHSIAEVGMVVGTLPWMWMALTPRPAVGAVRLVPLRDLAEQLADVPEVAMVQIGANLMVFAALGSFAPVRFGAAAGVVRLFALGAAGSVLVEGVQFALDLGRVSSVDDVLLNAAGAALAGLASRPWWTRAARVAAPATI